MDITIPELLVSGEAVVDVPVLPPFNRADDALSARGLGFNQRRQNLGSWRVPHFTQVALKGSEQTGDPFTPEAFYGRKCQERDFKGDIPQFRSRSHLE